ncbi:phosphoribosyltransferase family protein [Corynebacterium breve]|uniref:Phosphoribosyltransferase family protein n=1 Tax=Corynebacterium breve TaxID=3049799 RepID=A0ABY8VL48_9CORY|nr:phosphoribosyltransferase family protein [Corynebacterium breve]WIM68270.1 phosphoribosyltransferase family protein [Corynebacterium breve]
MKERNNLAVRKHSGAVLRAGLEYLEARGELPYDTVLVPAPTRAHVARSRGGDPVTDMCKATGRSVAPVLSMGKHIADQSDLGALDRRRNLAGRVHVSDIPQGKILLVDDVVTTGSTLQTAAESLIGRGSEVVGALVLAAA